MPTSLCNFMQFCCCISLILSLGICWNLSAADIGNLYHCDNVCPSVSAFGPSIRSHESPWRSYFLEEPLQWFLFSLLDIYTRTHWHVAGLNLLGCRSNHHRSSRLTHCPWSGRGRPSILLAFYWQWSCAEMYCEYCRCDHLFAFQKCQIVFLSSFNGGLP